MISVIFDTNGYLLIHELALNFAVSGREESSASIVAF